MTYCPTCKEDIHYMGYPRHRTMHHEDKEKDVPVVYGHRRHTRHKCSICWRVRYEKFMKEINGKTRWGNERWVCADIDDKEHNKEFFPYY